jgi:hypothetical protein
MMTQFVFYSRSADKRPGKGVNEVIDVNESYEELALIPDWRKKLSNMYISPLK